jgi:hypothetical protein
MAEEKTKNEGEGSRTAAATYNEKTRCFVENEDVEAKAEEAADALDSHEGGELRKAEETDKASNSRHPPRARPSSPQGPGS